MVSRGGDGGSSAVNRLSITTSNANPRRMSIDEFYSDPRPSLPEYDPLIRSYYSRPNHNLQPREDEGCETLPSYSCAISLENVFLKKMELEDAVRRASERNWNRVFVTLRGTALLLHKYKSSGVLGPKGGLLDKYPDFAVGTNKGEFLRSYNLQYADVGIAADYTKFVLSPSS